MGYVQAQAQGQLHGAAQRRAQEQLQGQLHRQLHGQLQPQLQAHWRGLAHWSGNCPARARTRLCHGAAPGKVPDVAHQYESEGHAYCSKRGMVGV